MGFFDDLSKSITDASQSALQKGKGMTDIAKMTAQINSENKKITQMYEEIGRRYVEGHANDTEAEFADAIRAIQEIKQTIQQLQDKIAEIKGEVICPKCGATVAAGVNFCPKCGAKIDRPEAAEVVADVEPSVSETSAETSAVDVELAGLGGDNDNNSSDTDLNTFKD